MNRPGPFVVLKFGGTSVSSPERWRTIVRVVKEHVSAGDRVVLVHSAIRGVTDLLHGLALDAQAGNAVAVDAGVDRLRALHLELAAGLTLREVPGLEGELDFLRNQLRTERAEAVPRDPHLAEVLATGERLVSWVGAAALVAAGIDTTWVDARDLLTAKTSVSETAQPWLSAECDAAVDPEVQERVAEVDGVLLTQGFTARTPGGETVVLGRGGSDTAAACLAGKLDADRLEVWSDVPGMFTADPRLVPAARLLRSLGYREAQEIATTGSAVLHPRCIQALRDRGIPIHLRSILHPDIEGTIIRGLEGTGPAQVKALSRQLGVVLISMETVGMWQKVGFLAQAFGILADAGLSIDLVSTSETNVTVSLDASANLLDQGQLDRVVERLGAVSVVTVISPCASVSLVGRHIRRLLHRLGPVLEVFEGYEIRMVTQAASDLNLTVVVDEPQAEGLVRQLHALLVPESADPTVFGPRWTEIALGEAERSRT
jgi:diaminopimelate decarboxylase/aspartate kinase